MKINYFLNGREVNVEDAKDRFVSLRYEGDTCFAHILTSDIIPRHELKGIIARAGVKCLKINILKARRRYNKQHSK